MANKIDKIILAIYAILFGALVFGVIHPRVWVAATCITAIVSLFVSPSAKLVKRMYGESKTLIALSAANYALAALYALGVLGVGFVIYVATAMPIAIITLFVGAKIGRSILPNHEYLDLFNTASDGLKK